MMRHLDMCESREEFVFTAAQVVHEAARDAVAKRGRFLLALSGGSTPGPLYEELARGEFRMPWEKTHVFFSDERAVPPDDARSNFHMARESLLDRVPLPEGHVHRIKGELGAAAAADAYEAEVREVVAAPGEQGSLVPEAVFDLVLLGMGPDGHTASLFPGAPTLGEEARCFVAAPVPALEPHVERVTMTLPCIASARRVAVLTGAKGKREALEAVLGGAPGAAERYPVARVSAAERLYWIVRP
ncbi:6-phosphogluconolactonase [Desulfovibrio sp. X2]|uniref:6-phosphogluconolactonase n=1 Tax=Desulfovibrio sp. X2 TaxID=941449 RepID=UPI0003587B25|nr:6-phosphogluconolactonase [Desulfovibrio sp. X2]EPR44089.1 6-phosphogluconolactonase [Desulfovibrio sp. X2]